MSNVITSQCLNLSGTDEQEQTATRVIWVWGTCLYAHHLFTGSSLALSLALWVWGTCLRFVTYSLRAALQIYLFSLWASSLADVSLFTLSCRNQLCAHRLLEHLPICSSPIHQGTFCKVYTFVQQCSIVSSLLFTIMITSFTLVPPALYLFTRVAISEKVKSTLDGLQLGCQDWFWI